VYERLTSTELTSRSPCPGAARPRPPLLTAAPGLWDGEETQTLPAYFPRLGPSPVDSPRSLPVSKPHAMMSPSSRTRPTPFRTRSSRTSTARSSRSPLGVAAWMPPSTERQVARAVTLKSTLLTCGVSAVRCTIDRRRESPGPRADMIRRGIRRREAPLGGTALRGLRRGLPAPDVRRYGLAAGSDP
jgi:hypothetical protein